MIKFYKLRFKINKSDEQVVKDRMISNTCKTNISPQLIFRQSYTGITNKSFIGNWTKDGFWISKFRLQLIQLRPDIIARFHLISDQSFTQIRTDYSIGFSSLFIGFLWIFLFSLLFILIGIIGYIIGTLILIIFYILLVNLEFENLRLEIRAKIFKEIELIF